MPICSNSKERKAVDDIADVCVLCQKYSAEGRNNRTNTPNDRTAAADRNISTTLPRPSWQDRTAIFVVVIAECCREEKGLGFAKAKSGKPIVTPSCRSLFTRQTRALGSPPVCVVCLLACPLYWMDTIDALDSPRGGGAWFGVRGGGGKEEGFTGMVCGLAGAVYAACGARGRVAWIVYDPDFGRVVCVMGGMVFRWQRCCARRKRDRKARWGGNMSSSATRKLLKIEK